MRNRIKIVLSEKERRSSYIANEMGVTKTTVSRWINNKQQPTLANLYKIAGVLNVPVFDLLVCNKVSTDEF